MKGLSKNTHRVLVLVVLQPGMRTSQFNGMDRRALSKLETLGLVALGQEVPYTVAVKNHRGEVTARVGLTWRSVTATEKGRAVAAGQQTEEGGERAAGGES